MYRKMNPKQLEKIIAELRAEKEKKQAKTEESEKDTEDALLDRP